MNFLNEKKLFFDEIEGKIFLVGNEVKKYEAKTPTFLNGQKLIKYKLLNNMKNLIKLTDEGINFMLDKDTVNGNFLKAHATFFYSIFKIILGQKASQKKMINSFGIMWVSIC